jgi:hypothetical protein
MATVQENMSKTEDQVSEIISLVNSLKNIQAIFGGSGLHLMPNVKNKISLNFNTFSDLKNVVTSI